MTHYVLRCGCNFKTSVKTLTRAVNCKNCGWPLIYQARKRAHYVSRHAIVCVVTDKETR